MIRLYISIGIGGLVIGGLGGFYGYKTTLTQKALAFKAKMAKVKELEEEILAKAEAKGEKIIEETKQKAEKLLEEGEKRANKLEETRQKDIDKRVQQVEDLEARLLKREEKMDDRLDKLEEQKLSIAAQQKEAETFIEQQKTKLEEISNYSPQQAKEELFTLIENEYSEQKHKFIAKLKGIAKEEADKEANHIIARSLPRVSHEVVNEYTTVSVDIPNEEFKGKLIGREGRNVNFFEKTTGCELIIDDTPLTVRLSCYDHDTRFIGEKVLKKLIKDTRVNPHYIEEFYQETVKNFDQIMIDKGKEALSELNLPMMKPELVKMIGEYALRYSYGQSLRHHSLEVAKIAESIASEMGVDPQLAAKAGILHDIGKLTVQRGESHALIGGDVLRKYNVDERIINAAESHHGDKDKIHVLSRIIEAADAISGARPGARFNTREKFIEKMKSLEKLITETTGIDKVHIMQAGRDIMVYTDPDKVDDKNLNDILKEIATKIEEQLDYPGIIRVTGIREKKLVEFIK